MTEAEWLACEDVKRLLEWVGWGMRPARKWRLFALACIEPIRGRLRDERLTTALTLISLDVEGQSEPFDLERANHEATAAHDWIWADASEQRWFYVSEYAARAVVLATQTDYQETGLQIATCCADALRLCADYSEEETVRRQTNRRQVALIHEIFGNPFRPVSLDPWWLTFDVQALAQGIYDESAFDRMPILADALQDAGCDNEDILNHCRDTKQIHVRGCWVVDLLLGKG